MLQSNQCATLCRNGSHVFEADLRAYTLRRKKLQKKKMAKNYNVTTMAGVDDAGQDLHLCQSAQFEINSVAKGAVV